MNEIIVDIVILLAGLWSISATGPSFDFEPPSQVLFDNSTGTIIRCSTKGSPVPSVRWETKEGSVARDIVGLRYVRPDGAMVFSPFSANQYRRDIHDTTYRCVASNPSGTLGSRDVRVRAALLQNYKLTAYDAEFVIRGNVAVLRCEVSGNGKEFAFVTSWFRDDGLAISFNDNSGKYAVFLSGELHVRHVDESDAARKYRCQGHDKLTRATKLSDRWARIIMTEPHGFVPPRIIHWIRDIQAHEGDTTWIPCASHGYPVPSTRLYKQDGGILTLLPASHRISVTEGTLVIHRAGVQDSGKYVCVVNNSAGEEQVQTTLVIRAQLRATISPPTTSIAVESSLILTCEVSGSPIHFLEWKKNMDHLQMDGRVKQQSNNILEISPVAMGDEGVYQCFIYNAEESAQGSATVTIQADPPQLFSGFQEQTLHPGVPLSLRCVAKGHPLPKITWRADNEPLPISSRLRLGDFVTQDGSTVHSFLNISRLEIDDGKEYSCHAESEFGKVTNKAFINVLGPPLARAPRNKTALVGSTVMLNCPVAGHPLQTFSWGKDDVNLPNSHRHELKSDGRLLIHYVERKKDEGIYWCTASNPRGSTAKGRVDMHVVAGPVIDPFVFPGQIREGRRTSLQCVVSAGDPPITFHWLKDNKPLDHSSIGITMEIMNQFTSTLFFESVRQKHNGNYTCVATNPYASTKHSAMLLIQIPPRWKLEPQDTEVVQGSSTKIDCQAEGYPRPVIRWKQLTGSPGSPEGFQTVMSNARLQVLENGTLLILEAAPSDSGSFLCQAFNSIGPGLSKMAKLTVHIPANFKSKFIARKVKKDESVSMDCKAYGDKPLSITWLKDGKQLTNSSIPRYTKRIFEHQEGVTSQLTVHAVKREDSAVFTCRSFNEYGRDETVVELIVQEPPDHPAQVEVVHVSSRSFHLRWSHPFTGNSAISRYLVVTELAKGSGPVITTDVPGSQTETSVRGLTPRKTYNVHILAENALGRSIPGQILSILTDDEVPRKPPHFVRTTARSSTSIHVSWKAAAEEEHESTISGYYIGYKPVGTEEPYLFKTIKVSNEFRSECLLTNLRSSTKYSIIVQAFNEKGPGPQSDEVFAETLKRDPPATSTLKIVKKTAYSIQIAWDSDGPVDGYLAYLKNENGEWKEATIARDHGTYIFEQLQCGTSYQFYVVPYSGLGKGKPSEVLSSRTEGTAPTAPLKESFLQTNLTTAVINLSTWDDGGCPITHYNVRYRAQTEHAWTTVTEGHLAEGPRVALTGLRPGQIYKLVLGAGNGAGYTESDYEFSTRRLEGESINRPAVSESTGMELQRKVAVITSAVCSSVVLIVILVAACTVLRRRRRHRPEGPDQSVDRRSIDIPKAETVALTAWEKRPREIRQSHCRESIYLPCPYATGRLSQFSTDGETDNGGIHSAISSFGNDHSYDVPIHMLSKAH